VLVPFGSDVWRWGEVEHEPVMFRGRRCVVARGFAPVLADVELEDGTIELELAVGAERSFHGVLWRAQDDENHEAFFVRAHQVGNPDSIQYMPVFNGVPSWQLHHGDGFSAPVSFPLADWFRIRVVFAGQRAEVFVADLDAPALVCELRRAAAPGRIGVLVGGPEVHLAEFAYEPAASLLTAAPPPGESPPGTLCSWEVSDAFPEDALERALAGTRTWTVIESEPSGLLNLARVQGINDRRNTVLARTAIESPRAETRLLELGFSDRAVVYLNGRPLFRGADAYLSRDYRFLGSIGWYDALYLPLEAGRNDLVVAVSEEFGGWGVQARLASA
jgi:hypothetical protein